MVNIVSIQENSTVQNTIISIYVNGWVRFGLPVRYHSGLNFWSGLGLPFRYVSLVLFGYKENKERLQKVHKNCKYFIYIKRKESGLKYTYLYFCVFGVLFIRAATFSMTCQDVDDDRSLNTKITIRRWKVANRLLCTYDICGCSFLNNKHQPHLKIEREREKESWGWVQDAAHNKAKNVHIICPSDCLILPIY